MRAARSCCAASTKTVGDCCSIRARPMRPRGRFRCAAINSTTRGWRTAGRRSCCCRRRSDPVSCSRASLIAVSFALASQAGQQQSAPAATHWEHTLVRHEKYEDFEGGTGMGVQMAFDPPLTLTGDYAVPTQGDPGPAGPLETRVVARYVSSVITATAGFQDALLSWNFDSPAGTG